MGPAVTVDPSAGSVRFGVVSCGKRAPGPFEKKLGVCILEPGHGDDVPCRFKNLDGPGSVSVSVLPVPDDIAEAVADLGRHIGKLERTRRNMRRTSAGLVGALVLNLGTAVWSFLHAMGWGWW